MVNFTLMNKDYKVLDFSYDEKLLAITKINKIYKTKYLPYPINKNTIKDNLIKSLSLWLTNRFHQNSKWYKELVKRNYKITLVSAIYTKSYGLSLSDQYWIKPSFDKKKWVDVNFYTNDFEFKHFLEISLEGRDYNYEDVDVLYSPDITTGGELGKCWIIDSKSQRILYKSSNTFLGLEPINEMLSTKICKILDVSCVNYKVQILSNLKKKIMVSACPTFCNKFTELIPFSDLNIHNSNYEIC